MSSGPSVTLRRDETVRRALAPCEDRGSYAPANYRKEQRDDTCNGVASNNTYMFLGCNLKLVLFINSCCCQNTVLYHSAFFLFLKFLYKKYVFERVLL